MGFKFWSLQKLNLSKREVFRYWVHKQSKFNQKYMLIRKIEAFLEIHALGKLFLSWIQAFQKNL